MLVQTCWRTCLIGMVASALDLGYPPSFSILLFGEAGGTGAVCWPGSASSPMNCLLDCAAHCFLVGRDNIGQLAV